MQALALTFEIGEALSCAGAILKKYLKDASRRRQCGGRDKGEICLKVRNDSNEMHFTNIPSEV